MEQIQVMKERISRAKARDEKSKERRKESE
jgi:hypothetical protein